MYLKPLPQTAFSIVRRDIAEARAQATEARAESARYRGVIERALGQLREPRPAVSRQGLSPIDRAIHGLSLALVG